MSERKFSRSFDMPTVDPDTEDESKYSGRGNKIASNYKVSGSIRYSNGSVIDFEDEIEDTHEPYKIKKTAKEILKDRSRAHVCKHEWKMYTGLSEQFEFCILCDEKRK